MTFQSKYSPSSSSSIFLLSLAGRRRFVRTIIESGKETIMQRSDVIRGRSPFLLTKSPRNVSFSQRNITDRFAFEQSIILYLLGKNARVVVDSWESNAYTYITVEQVFRGEEKREDGRSPLSRSPLAPPKPPPTPHRCRRLKD